MNEIGKRKHRVHILVFRRGATPEKDVPVAHIVVNRSRARATWRKLCRRFDAGHVGWFADEVYWRKHGTGGKTNMIKTKEKNSI